MKNIKLKLIIISLFFLGKITAQKIKVYGKINLSNKPLIEKLCLPEQNKCVDVVDGFYNLTINDTGNFYFELRSNIGIEYNNYLRVSIIQDSIEININDKEYVLDEVVIGLSFNKNEVGIPTKKTSREKLAVGGNTNLCEGINSINGINARSSCGVCNSTEIQINNLSGIYSSICIDGVPNISGLGSSYGLSGLPLGLIKELNVTKGPFTSKISNEGIAGTIDVVTRDFDDIYKREFIFQSNSLGELDLNIGLKGKIKTIEHLFYINGSGTSFSIDNNNDSFTDFSNYKKINIYYSSNLINDKNKKLKITSRSFLEDRWGGEMSWTKKDKGTENKYGEVILTKRTENNFQFQKRRNEHLFNIVLSHTFHEQDSYYGTNKYFAKQQIGFTQFEYAKNAKYLLIENGISFRGTINQEKTNLVLNQKNNEFNRVFNAGYFLECEWIINKKFSFINSGRVDYNTISYWLPSYRVGINYRATNNLKLTLFAGNAYRQLQFISEEHALLNGSRKIERKLNKPVEESWSVTTIIKYILNKGSSFNSEIEYGGFYTNFNNKIVMDYESSPDKIILKNTLGKFNSYGFYITINSKIKSRWEINFGLNNANINFTEKTNEQEIKQKVYFNPRFTFTYSTSYNFKNNKTKLIFSGATKSPMLLPLAEKDFRPEQSPWFSLINLFLSRSVGEKINLQLGVKNLMNFIPEHPILRSEDPFEKVQLHSNRDYSFDATYNYAPVKGIHFVIILKYNLN
jgi:outer membrane receptor for ferrienterochelin and colicins